MARQMALTKAIDTNDGYINLANAIIVQAADDYLKALRRLKKHPDSQKYLDEITELETFFHSEKFEILTDVDPDYILDRLQKEVEGEETL